MCYFQQQQAFAETPYFFVLLAIKYITAYQHKMPPFLHIYEYLLLAGISQQKLKENNNHTITTQSYLHQ